MKGLLGSLQWLVAQIRFDLAFIVSQLQSEVPTVGTLLRANKAIQDAKKNSDYELRFRNVNFQQGGILVVTDAALGNVNSDGQTSGDPLSKVHSQACYAILLADPALLSGAKGWFNCLDFRSHRIARVCRSSYAAETLAAEEGLDCGELVRGFIAESRGIPVDGRDAFLQISKVPMVGVTDAKDVFDRVTQDVGFGTQKSLMFSIANLRQQLKRPNTQYRWTATDNLFVDGGTKLMSSDHLRQTLMRGQWSIEFQQEFVKQTSKRKKNEETPEDAVLPGRAPNAEDTALLQHAQHLSEAVGWHFVNGIGVHVAAQAKSYRTPGPRFSIRDFPYRTTVAEFRGKASLPKWRILEEHVDLRDLAQHQEILHVRANRLVTFFAPSSKATQNKTNEKAVFDP